MTLASQPARECLCVYLRAGVVPGRVAMDDLEYPQAIRDDAALHIYCLIVR
jgi:hypothetical protein